MKHYSTPVYRFTATTHGWR